MRRVLFAARPASSIHPSKVTPAVLLQSEPSIFYTHNNLLFAPIVIIAVCTMFGALIGSFLNVVIYRLPRGESLAFPNSRCPHCGTAIKVYDNIPVLSYLILGGRCRACGVRISPRYPAVEALTATLFFLVAYFVANGEPSLGLIFDLLFVAALIALVFIDAEHMILPNKITYPGIIIALVARLIVPNLYGAMWLANGVLHDAPAALQSLANSLLGALLGGGSLWLVGWLWKRLRGVDAMGLGDVKMMLMVGAYLGALLTPLAIFVGFLLGALIGIAWMWRTGTRDMNAQIPFGISLGIGSIISLLFGTRIVSWYLAQIGM